jgi:AcrR family transcriptional regulator
MNSDTRRKRASLSRERVLNAACRLADASGMAKVTMRSVAAELGVEAMSLYNHVSNKEDLLNGLADLVAAEIDLRPDGKEAFERLRSLMLRAHGALASHAWSARVWITRKAIGPHRSAFLNALLELLKQAGLSEELVYHSFHTLENYLVGYSMQAADFPFVDEELGETGRRVLGQVEERGHAHLAEHVRQHLNETFGGHSGFAFGLGLILDGLAGRR